MLSTETENRLARFLISLAEGERTIEISRQVLSDCYDFDPYKIFKVLDKEDKDRIDSSNIIDFLKEKGICCNKSEAQLIIMFYDQDYDGALSYSEFISLVQSEKCAKKIPSLSEEDEPNLSFNVVYALGKLLEKELELARVVTTLLNDLKCRYDFNIHDLYHEVKGYNYITPESIRDFLEKNSISFLDSDVSNILKRLDFNRDGRGDFCEFHALMGFPKCSYCCPCLACSCCGSCYCDSCFCYIPCYLHRRAHRSLHSPERNYNRKFSPKSPQRQSNNNNIDNLSYSTENEPPQEEKSVSNSLKLRISPKRKYGPRLISCDICHYDPCRCCYTCHLYPCCCTTQDSLLKRTKRSPSSTQKVDSSPEKEVKKISNTLVMRTSPERKYGPQERGPSNPNEYEEKQFSDFLSTLMDGESQIEEAKSDLANKPDFNIEDAFRIFELDGRGYLDSDDLRYGLNLLNIYPSDNDIQLLLKRFDIQGQGVINFADFFDMLVPFEKEYRNRVENRIPNSICPYRCPDIFEYPTLVSMKNVLRLIIDFEKTVNQLRKGFTSLNLKLNDIYRLIDNNNKGYFDNVDLVNYLKDAEIFTEPKDADLLFIRLDKNRVGKIGFDNVADETQPLY